jgi:hypothetical protein
MNDEISIGGVFLPKPLLLVLAAVLLAGLILRLLGPSGFYRFVAYKALVDLAIFVLVMGGLAFLAIYFGL